MFRQQLKGASSERDTMDASTVIVSPLTKYLSVDTTNNIKKKTKNTYF